MNNLILASKDDITVDAMNTILRNKLRGDSVKDLRVNTLGTGQMSEAYRVSLNYLNSSTLQLPNSLVVKVQSEDESSRRIGKAGFYLREIRFYQEYSSRLAGIVPDCLYSEIDEDTQSFTLVLQDMAPSQQGDQLKGCTIEEAKSVIKSLAKTHALTWGDSSLDNLYWLADTTAGRTKDWIYNLDKNLFSSRWNQFRTRFKEKLSDDHLLIGNQLADNFDRYLFGTDTEKCLVHGDLRSDNLLFENRNGSTVATIVDWQVAGYAPGAKDLAYFLGTSLTTELRRANEEELLKLYLDTLVANDISNYSTEKLRADYRFYSFSGFVMAVAASMEVEQTERGDEMFMKMFSLPCELIRDSNALALLEC